MRRVNVLKTNRKHQKQDREQEIKTERKRGGEEREEVVLGIKVVKVIYRCALETSLLER